ncbi:hypothetical protein ACX8XP_12505 [Calditrichota bacterium LG25]
MTRKLSELENLRIGYEVLNKSALKSIFGGNRPPDRTNDADKGDASYGGSDPGAVCVCACSCKSK